MGGSLVSLPPPPPPRDLSQIPNCSDEHCILKITKISFIYSCMYMMSCIHVRVHISYCRVTYRTLSPIRQTPPRLFGRRRHRFGSSVCLRCLSLSWFIASQLINYHKRKSALWQISSYVVGKVTRHLATRCRALLCESSFVNCGGSKACSCSTVVYTFCREKQCFRCLKGHLCHELFM